jgi:hypothetical protein
VTEPVDLEELLRRALAPVDPPSGLTERLETRLERMTAQAVEELEAFEPDALRDPRTWTRLVAAGGVIAAGTGAGAALLVLRARRRTSSSLRRRLRRP